jgi:hypothetical protein
VNGATAEGWNPGLADDACFAAADPEGFFIGELKGALAATVSCVNYVRVSRSSISTPCERICAGDCGRLKHWKMGGSGRIFREWRQLSDAIAAPSTNELKQSS